MMKKIFIGLAVVVGLFILFIWWGSTVETPESATPTNSTNTTEQTNQNFTSDKGNFSIFFEGTPTYKPNSMTLKSGEQVPAHLYQYNDAFGIVWQAFYTEYPEKVDVSSPNTLLLAGVEGTRASLEGEIKSTRELTYQELPAVEYVVYVPSEKVYFKGRNILKGHKFYSVSVIYDDTQVPAIDKFFNSLLIK